MLKRVLPLVIAVAIAGIAENLTAQSAEPATPFGLTFGASRAEVQKLTGAEASAETNRFNTTKVPTPHPAFSLYQFHISPTLGLCDISAVAGPIEANDFGDQVKRVYNDIAEQIAGRYGPHTRTVDALRTGSIWNDPNDWMMGLSLGERSLMRSWTNPAPNLSQIALIASAQSRRSGLVMLTYFSAFTAKCDAESKAGAGSAL